VCVPAVVLLVASLASATGGSLQNNGSVTVNGKWAGPASTIFAGDRLQVGRSSTSTITTDGSMALVGPNTSLIFAQNAVDISCGSILVTTTTAMQVRLAGLTVTPANSAEAKFEVSPTPSGIKITSREAPIQVEDGGVSSTLAPGQSTMRPGRAGCGVPVATVPVNNAWVAPVAVGAAAASGAIAYCAVNHWCEETTSPHVP
jgi:hypothetical protein